MPAKTSKLRPVIIYLDDDDFKEVQRMAEDDDRSVSYVGRKLVQEALAARRPKRDP